ncbi:hypothetical protein [Massilia aerilata]|uniref:Uncharacterized protein n=1 Tax=Massilia aerilata TaxID=453817 RepID=A0ABW0S679_9BURK
MSRATDLVEQLFRAAFDRPRDPRSAEYKEGVRAILVYRIKGGLTRCPYAMGTASADAYYAGTDEGHRIWRAHEETLAQGGAAKADEPSQVC